MGMVDVFGSDTFKTLSLTNALNKLPFKPSRIGRMNLFAQQGVRNTTVVLEERSGTLTLLKTKVRGGPPALHSSSVRVARSFAIPHIPLDDNILAEAVQDVRAFGSESAEATVAQTVNDHLQEMRDDHEVTLEHLRIGAIKGNILDADGTSVIFDLFAEFGITETSVDFLLGTAGTDIREKILTVARAIENALGAAAYDHIHCACSQTFFDALIKHADVASAYDRFKDGAFFREDPRAGFAFAGAIFEEYVGSVGGVAFIPAGDARFFPVGVPRLFKTYFAPADFMETVNTIGKPLYAKQEKLDLNRGIRLHTQQNPLPMCHIPGVLVRGFSSD